MGYRVEVLPAARRDLADLPRRVRARVAERLRGLADDPRPAGSSPLSSSLRDLRKIRVGAYRVIYSVEDEVLVVLVIAAAHRSRAYDVVRRRT